MDLFKLSKELYWCLKEQPSSKFKGADNEEKVVLRIIEDAGNKGIWNRDIRTKSNLNQTTLNKILKALEGKKLIKSVSSVSVINSQEQTVLSSSNYQLQLLIYIGSQEESVYAVQSGARQINYRWILVFR